MVDAELVIRDELKRLAPRADWADANWDDVLGRAGVRRRPRRRLLLAAAVLLVAAVAAPALAFRSSIVDFFSSAPASRSVVVAFGRLEAESRQFRDLGIRPRDARRVTSTHGHTLWVTRTRDGGFCALWSRLGGPECSLPPSRRHGIVDGLGWTSIDPQLGVDTITGVVNDRRAAVSLRYADGSSEDVPIVWVTKPIAAGFFLVLPRRRPRPVALVARVGSRVESRPVEDVATALRVVDHRDRWGLSVQTTPEAIWSKRRLLFAFNGRDGSLFELWVMPSRRGSGRRCFTSTVGPGFGCESREWTGAPLQLRVLGAGPGQTAAIAGEVAPTIRRVELRFEDGDTQIVAPRSGFVLAPIAVAQYAVGHRLVEATGLPLGRQSFDPRLRDVYPCAKKRAYGYGVVQCP